MWPVLQQLPAVCRLLLTAIQHIYSKKILGTSVSWLACFSGLVQKDYKKESFSRAGNKAGMPQLWREEPLEASGIWQVFKTHSVFRGEHPHPSSNTPYVCAFPVCAVESLCACRSSGRNWEPFSPKMCVPCPHHPRPSLIQCRCHMQPRRCHFAQMSSSRIGAVVKKKKKKEGKMKWLWCSKSILRQRLVCTFARRLSAHFFSSSLVDISRRTRLHKMAFTCASMTRTRWGWMKCIFYTRSERERRNTHC